MNMISRLLTQPPNFSDLVLAPVYFGHLLQLSKAVRVFENLNTSRRGDVNHTVPVFKQEYIVFNTSKSSDRFQLLVGIHQVTRSRSHVEFMTLCPALTA